MNIGFTGTRKGLSTMQFQVVVKMLGAYGNTEGTAHHGDCIGADDNFDRLVRTLTGLTPHIHPPTNTAFRAFCPRERAVMYAAKHYYARNRDIVNACDWLIACPKSDVEEGGTWYTINYAREEQEGRTTPLRITIIDLDGMNSGDQPPVVS